MGTEEEKNEVTPDPETRPSTVVRGACTLTKYSDADRLDYLQRTTQTLYRITDVLRVPSTMPGLRHTEEGTFLGWSLSNREDECATIREAIDVGLDQEQQAILDRR